MIGKKIIAVILVISIVSASLAWYFFLGNRNEPGTTDTEITALDGLYQSLDSFAFSNNTHKLKYISREITNSTSYGCSDVWHYSFWENSTSGWCTVYVDVYSDGTVTTQRSFVWGYIPSQLYGIELDDILIDSDEAAEIINIEVMDENWYTTDLSVLLTLTESVCWNNTTSQYFSVPYWSIDFIGEDIHQYNVDAIDGYITEV